MAFWSSERLRQNLKTLVPNATASQIEYSAVTLKVGSEAYVTPHIEVKDPQSHKKQTLKEGETISIPAGQFAFLLTEEEVKIPYNVIGFISIRAKTKFRGLVNVSGFHVDPGYDGRLVFSVFNAGPSRILVQRGDPLFLLWLSDLDNLAAAKDARDKPSYKEIPVELINNIPGEIYSLQSLSERLDSFDTKLERHIYKLSLYGAIAVFVLGFIFRGPLVDKVEEAWHGLNGSKPTVTGDQGIILKPYLPQEPAPSPERAPVTPSENSSGPPNASSVKSGSVAPKASPKGNQNTNLTKPAD